MYYNPKKIKEEKDFYDNKKYNLIYKIFRFLGILIMHICFIYI